MQEKLIILRKKENVSQETLANLIGITVKQYGAKENGKARFYVDETFKIANYFGLSVEDIFLPSNHQIGELNDE